MCWLTGCRAFCLSLGLLMHNHGLRLYLGLPSRVRLFMAAWLVAMLIYALLLLVHDLRLRALVSCSLLMAPTVVLALHAHWVSVRTGSAGARLVAWTQWLLGVMLAVRIVALLGGWTTVHGIDQGWDFVLLLCVNILTALYSNLGFLDFLGLMLVGVRAAELRARDLQLAETVRREAADRNTLDLRGLMAQRDRLSVERERLLQLLAHEIRQPLHNASGALQAASQALQRQPPADGQAVAQRLARAETVLGEVRSVLDNTLAAATLVTRSAPLAVQEVDLDFLIDLALGDLDLAQRGRVHVLWQTDLRQAEVEPGLLRLALRNLLVNAFSHGGPGVAVQLQVAEQAQPPALLLRVVDDGPGLSAATAAGDRRPGLGLGIVQQVVALHGGRLDLLPQAPHGVQAVLVLPLPAG